VKRLLLVGLLALLGACSGLSLAPTQAEQFLVLDVPMPAAVSAPPRREGSLLVAPTTTFAFYDTQDIAFSKTPGTRGRYQFSHWTEPPGQRIGGLIAARLQAAGAFRSVVANNGGVRGRWLLRTQVDEIYHDASSSPGTARLVLTAELSDPGKRELVARRTFSASVPATSFDAEGAAQGLRTGLAQVLDQLVPWVEASAVER
jgi:cholesterol transport system auxiliary component